MLMASVAMQYPYQKNWLERNWKWVVGLVILGFLALVTAFILGIVAVLGHSQAASMTVEEARKNPVIIEKLGQPIQRGIWVSAHINLYGSDGVADLAIPISGPKGKAT